MQLSFLACNAADDIEEDGSQEDAEQGDAEGTPEHGGAERATHLGPAPRCMLVSGSKNQLNPGLMWDEVAGRL